MWVQCSTPLFIWNMLEKRKPQLKNKWTEQKIKKKYRELYFCFKITKLEFIHSQIIL